MPTVCCRSFDHLVLLFWLLACSCLLPAETFSLKSRQSSRASERYLYDQAKSLAQLYNATHYKVSVEAPPTRMKRPRCSEKPIVSVIKTIQVGNVATRVSCPDQDNENTVMQGYIRTYLPILVTSRTIMAGYPASSENISWQEHDISSLKEGYFTDLAQLEYKVARHKIKPNMILTPSLFHLNK